MTGFATAETVAESYQLSWELRSVNHRFLDLSFRLPDEFRRLEPELRNRISKVVARGKIDCTLKITSEGQAAARATLDPEVLATLHRLQGEILAEWPTARELAVADLMRWPGVLKEPEQEWLAAPASESFGKAVAALHAARQREGARIGQMLGERLAAINDLLSTIKPLLAGTTDRYRDKLLERLERVDVEADPGRLEQEVALVAQRLDVTEEADRIEAHVAEIVDVLKRDEPMGRRLDFLIQELNREANTLASKAQDEDLGRYAVELKVLIEQMREQVQNLE
jgi:uncharacterized protein (TIGR00255 family)